MATLYYTFRTNTNIDQLKKKKINPFIFGPLKKDFEIFSKKILKLKPRYVVGFANINTRSCFESTTKNKFGKKGKVNVRGIDSYGLYIPPKAQFLISDKTTNSFCNWTMYKIAELIKQNKLKTKLIFIHINPDDYVFLQNLAL